MSSVRPITQAEKRHARGEPLASYCAFFGLTSGIITHLNIHGMPAHKNWFPTPMSKLIGSTLILGGFFGGHFLGKKIFGSPELQRLADQHKQDRIYNRFN